jgi:hypothetical protein
VGYAEPVPHAERGCLSTFLAAGLVAGAASADDSPSALRLDGFLALRGSAVASVDSWLSGGFGRLSDGSGVAGEYATELAAELHAAVAWQPSEHFRAYLHATARHDPDAIAGQTVGVAESYLESRAALGIRDEARFRLGLMFQPTSRENVAPLWASPYTVTLSAVNSWIADEIRPAGIEALWAHTMPGGAELDILATAVRGCDTAGALIAWRGWAFGSRVSVVGEDLPLPPLPSLAPGGDFSAQRAGATQPLDELDGRTGFLGRARWRLPGVSLLQVAIFDNRGDRGQHGDQYAWATRFTQAGAELEPGPGSIVVGEWLRGETGMGPATGSRVDVGFEAWYLLASARLGETGRISLRFDRFSTEERDGTAEPSDESGWAVTGALLWRPVARFRVGLELLHAVGDRPAAAWSGANADVSGDRGALELRYSF